MQARCEVAVVPTKISIQVVSLKNGNADSCSNILTIMAEVFLLRLLVKVMALKDKISDEVEDDLEQSAESMCA